MQAQAISGTGISWRHAHHASFRPSTPPRPPHRALRALRAPATWRRQLVLRSKSSGVARSCLEYRSKPASTRQSPSEQAVGVRGFWALAQEPGLFPCIAEKKKYVEPPCPPRGRPKGPRSPSQSTGLRPFDSKSSIKVARHLIPPSCGFLLPLGKLVTPFV